MLVFFFAFEEPFPVVLDWGFGGELPDGVADAGSFFDGGVGADDEGPVEGFGVGGVVFAVGGGDVGGEAGGEAAGGVEDDPEAGERVGGKEGGEDGCGHFWGRGWGNGCWGVEVLCCD